MAFFLAVMCGLFYGVIVNIEGRNLSRSDRFLVDGNTISVSVNAHTSIHTVSDKFISVTLDTSLIEYTHLNHFDSSSEKVRSLAKGLAPAYLRVGGTSADALTFGEHASSGFTMSEHDFDTLNKFARDVGWEMIFNLNLLHRHHGQWDTTNAEVLLRYAASKGYVVNLELGNEPNLYERNGREVIDPAQMGRDYGILRHLMQSIHPFDHRLLIGPALTSTHFEDYSQKFLSTGSTYIDALTIHHYYMNGKTAQSGDFLDPHVLDSLKSWLDRASTALHKYSKGTHAVWIGETSSAYGGGAPTLSESFIAGFLWLDKLGMAAIHGVPVVARQNFVGGHYALLKGDNPLPDYWLTLLHKRLVGRKVLAVTSSEHNHKFRIYAHCSADHSHPKGVTFFFQNMYDSEVKMTIPQYEHHHYLLYMLTAGGSGGLTSTTVKLNGHDLHMNGNTLPHIAPLSAHTWPVKVPAHSFGFLVSPSADAAACS